MTMTNAVFWDINFQIVPNRKRITSSLQIQVGYYYVIFEVFAAVTIKIAVFWGVTPCGSCKNRRFEGTDCLHH
jgi:hypothetical protein